MTDAALPEPKPQRHSRKGLVIPFLIVGTLFAVWTGWWFYLSRQIETRLAQQVEVLRASGWHVEHGQVTTTGWPFRTHVEIKYLEVKAPSGQALGAPRLAAEANSFNPTKWVIVASKGLTLTRGDGKGQVTITGDAIRASVHGLRQAWPNIAVELVNPIFTAHQGAEAFPVVKAGRIEFYTRPHLAPSVAETPDGTAGPVGASPDAVDVLFRLIDAEGRPEGPVEGLAQNQSLNVQIEAVIQNASRLSGADAAGIFSAWTQAGGRFTHVRGEIRAGESRAEISSDVLTPQADGRLQGVLTLRADRATPAIAGLAASQADGVDSGAASGAARTAPDQGELTLEFRNGRTYMGPFALAPAPKLF